MKFIRTSALTLAASLQPSHSTALLLVFTGLSGLAVSSSVCAREIQLHDSGEGTARVIESAPGLNAVDQGIYTTSDLNAATEDPARLFNRGSDRNEQVVEASEASEANEAMDASEGSAVTQSHPEGKSSEATQPADTSAAKEGKNAGIASKRSITRVAGDVVVTTAKTIVFVSRVIIVISAAMIVGVMSGLLH